MPMDEPLAENPRKHKRAGPRYSIIPAAFVYDERPGIWHFRVLNLLGRHTDANGWCVLSQSLMAQDINTTRETVNRTIRDLCEWGYVQKTGQGTDRRSVCFYRVIMDPEAQPEVCDEPITCDDSITGGCDDSDHRGVTAAITGGVITAITPITTLSKRPNINDLERERVSDKGAHAPREVVKAVPAIEIKAGEACFAEWIEHLRKIGQSGLADDARDAGVMHVTKRWPSGEDLPIPKPKPQNGLSDMSRRIMGEPGK
jgi:hypothetical protein